MKTPGRWMFLGAMLAGLLGARAPLHAQPAREPGPAGEPGPAREPGPAGGERPPAGDDPIAIDDPEKPWSQGVSIEDRTAARALFLEGNRLFRIPLFARAAEKYAAALTRWKHPAFHFNLALAQLNLGQEVEARENLEHALAHGEEPLGARFQEARDRLEETRRLLGQIRVTCRTRAAEVTLDGATLFVGPGTHRGWVKATAHELTARKAGYQSEARRVTVSPGELLEIDLSLVTLTQAADASRRWAAWKPWAVVAAGGAIAAAGGVFHALSARSFNAYDERFLRLGCATPSDDQPTPGCKTSQIPRTTRAGLGLARRQQTIAVSSYFIGGTLISAGVALLHLNRPRLREHAPISPPAQHVAVVPAVSADMIGALISINH